MGLDDRSHKLEVHEPHEVQLQADMCASPFYQRICQASSENTIMAPREWAFDKQAF